MGLKEKRAAKEFVDTRLDSLLAQVSKQAKFEVDVEIDWDTLSVDDYSHLYDEAWPKVYFKPLIAAFKDMCADDLSREALQEGVKKVVICNHSDNYSAQKWARFKDGTLTLNHSPIINVNEVDARAEALKYVIEKEL